MNVIHRTFTPTWKTNYFEFPYDWRRDNRAAAKRLAIDSAQWLLEPYPVEISLRIHDRARHRYAMPNCEMFDARAAARDWALTCAMFHRQSPPCAW